MNITLENGNTYDLSPAAISAYSNAELLEILNSTLDKPLKTWKQSKVKLVDRLMAEFDLVSVKTVEAEPAKKPQRVKVQKPKTSRGLPKSYQLLQLVVERSEQGNYLPIAVAVDALSTSEGSVRSYLSYFRKGIKGHDKIDIKLIRGDEGGMYLETKDDLAAAIAGIAARQPKEQA